MGKVYFPTSLDTVLGILSAESSVRLYAGGTDVFARMEPSVRREGILLCLDRVEALRGLKLSNGELCIGALTTHSEIASSGLVAYHLPLLGQAVRQIGSPAIRNMGTIGGNICTASPAGDSLPPLYIFGADVELISSGGIRRVPIDRFITGPGRTGLKPGECLSAVRMKVDHGLNYFHFEKVGQRRAMAISIASFAFAAALHKDGTIERALSAFGSVAPTVFTSSVLNESLSGGRLTGTVLRKAAAIAREGISPISDIRASARYRRTVTGNLILRLEGAGGN